MKKILITGAGSYIGTSFESYMKKNYASDCQIDTLDMLDGSWRNKSFSGYDTVYHVAGIAHSDIGGVTEERKALYYKVNTDLTIETAKKAKADGVRQFIFMSSSIVYGDSAPMGRPKVITKDTPEAPANFYGDSKLQAEKGILSLKDEKFKICILRPPMIYGKNSKGNYPLLARMAKKLPLFPKIENQRSMLYIENLCEFLAQLIEQEKEGIYFPQNAEYTNTCEMVKEIANVSGHKIMVTGVLNPVIWLAGKIPGKVSGLANKAFGNMVYDLGMSKYDFADYQKISLRESIAYIEGEQ